MWSCFQVAQSVAASSAVYVFFSTAPAATTHSFYYQSPHTMELLNKGHVGTRSFVLYREVSFIRRLQCTGIIGVGTSRFVLYREVFFIRSVLYWRFHCNSCPVLLLTFLCSSSNSTDAAGTVASLEKKSSNIFPPNFFSRLTLFWSDPRQTGPERWALGLCHAPCHAPSRPKPEFCSSSLPAWCAGRSEREKEMKNLHKMKDLHKMTLLQGSTKLLSKVKEYSQSSVNIDP